MTAPQTLVLFDIDGTLVDVRGAGRRVFARAIAETWGVTDELADVTFAGATDLGILAQLRARLPLSEERTETFFDTMTRLLAAELAREPPVALPHAQRVVAELARRDDVVLGLLTGNARACARIKVESAGIDFSFLVGGYGDEHEDRRELARRARGSFSSVVVVGDTLRDVEAARAIGARAIAVCTGRFGRDALSSADVVADTLGDVDWRAFSAVYTTVP